MSPLLPLPPVPPFLCLHDVLSRPLSRFMFKRMLTKVPNTIVVRRGAHSVNPKTVRREQPGRTRFTFLQRGKIKSFLSTTADHKIISVLKRC